MKNGWQTKPFPNCLTKIKAVRGGQIQASQFQASGKYPIVDQGRMAIAGWTDDAESVIADDLPLVVFGDHTRALKYVDFPFALGADGTKLIRPNPSEFNCKFFYYFLLSLDIPSKGYNRHFKLLKEKEVHYPPLPEQRKIATVLSKIQRAVELQEATIANFRELKKSLMHRLFACGLRGEKTKQTEIGKMPSSWEAKLIGDIIDICQYGTSERCSLEGLLPVLRINNLTAGRIDVSNLKYNDFQEENFEKYRLLRGDLLFNRTNSIDLVGKTAIFDLDFECAFSSYLIRLRVKDGNNPFCLNYYLNCDSTQSRLKGFALRAVGQANISGTRIRSVVVPLPPKAEQTEIANILRTFDEKLAIHETKKSALQDLFKTTLNQLMTGTVRVADLDIDTSEVEV